MKVFYSLVLSAMTLFSFHKEIHKFYLSVSQVEIDAQKNRITVVSRLFIDDVEYTIKERYGVSLHLDTEEESLEASTYLQKYLRAKFRLSTDAKPLEFEFSGYTYQNDQLVVLLEYPGLELSQINTIQIQNELLTDAFSEQQNLVHIKETTKKRSEVLTKEAIELTYRR